MDTKVIAAALAGDIGTATGLPGRCYGAEALLAERDRLFGRCWTPVATAASLPAPGDMLAVDLAGWPLLLVRGKDGGIAVFFNICRHRGMRLVDGKACASVIRCPWHSWAYGLDGRLLATPHFHGVNDLALAPDKSALGLKPVRSALWLDYVFVDLSGTLPPLAEQLAGIDAELQFEGRAALVHDGRWDHVYPGNWKIAMEGAIEDYHVFWGHPQLLTDGKWRGAVTWGEAGVYAVTAADDGQPSAQAGDIGLPALPVTGPLANAVINIFPTAVIGMSTDHVMLGLMLPDGPERTRISFDYYFRPEAMTDAHAGLRARRREEWETVAPQDEAYVAGVQANAIARDLAGIDTCFAPAWEGAVRLFQQSVAMALDR